MNDVFAGPAFTPKQVLDQPDVIGQIHDEHTCCMLANAANYLSRILTRPNPMLGRPGAVCPFVGAALLDNMVTMRVLPLRTPDIAMLRRAALATANGFPPVDGGGAPARAEALRAVIILLPLLDAEDAAPLIETVQKALKPQMVRTGLMIGEFFPGCSAPGLNNPEFRPADTSFAFLAIRRMTAGDLPFLLDDPALVDSYLVRFGEDGRRRLDRLRAASNTPADAGELPAAIVAQSALSGGLEQFSIHAG